MSKSVSMPKSVIVGASSGVGRALALALAARGHVVVLAAQDERDLAAVAADIEARGGSAEIQKLDLAASDFDAEAFRAACGPAEAVFAVAGVVDEADDVLAPDVSVQRLIDVNYRNTVRLLQTFARAFEARGRGLLVGFSSIAAAAPRGRNMVYASAKAGLETYLRALRHHFAGTGVRVQGYALGYVDTAMTYGKRLLPPQASPEQVAARVVANLDRDCGVVFYPCYWRLVTGLLRLLPWFIYRRLSF